MNCARLRGLRSCACLTACLAVAAARAGGDSYQFTIDEKVSGLSASLGFNLQTSGTLVGNWDPNSNPGGTRTKPGLFGPFGPTENVPVPVTIGVGVNGKPQSASSGGFGATLNPKGGSIGITALSANLLADGPVGLGTELSLEYASFRTRAPDSIYIGIPGTPLVLPLGNVTLTQLTAAQTGAALGILTPSGLNTFDFAVAVPVSLSVGIDVLGNPLDVPDLPAVLPLAGQIVLNGDSARLMSVQDVGFKNTQEIGEALPQIPFDLPTILPPGETAHLLLDLILEQIGVNMSGQLTLAADGLLIPEPGGAACVALGALWGLRRRRRVP